MSLINCLGIAKKTLDIAVFIITSQDLGDVIIQLHVAGWYVHIRRTSKKKNPKKKKPKKKKKKKREKRSPKKRP